MLEAVTTSMVALDERLYHRAPATAKSQLMSDELLACVMGGVYTDVEKTLIELQRYTVVQKTRSAFQHAIQDRFIAEVQPLSGRRVTASSRTPTSAPTSRSNCSCSPRPANPAQQR
jgi:hypothetical protein